MIYNWHLSFMNEEAIDIAFQWSREEKERETSGKRHVRICTSLLSATTLPSRSLFTVDIFVSLSMCALVKETIRFCIEWEMRQSCIWMMMTRGEVKGKEELNEKWIEITWEQSDRWRWIGLNVCYITLGYEFRFRSINCHNCIDDEKNASID